MRDKVKALQDAPRVIRTPAQKGLSIVGISIKFVFLGALVMLSKAMIGVGRFLQVMGGSDWNSRKSGSHSNDDGWITAAWIEEDLRNDESIK